MFIQKFKLGLLFPFILFVSIVEAQNSLRGHIYDRSTNEVIIGAQIYIPDIRLGAVSDTNGYYELKDVAKRFLTIQVSAFGYDNQSMKIQILNDTIINFFMEQTVIEKQLNEVVITANSHSISKNKTPLAISTLSLAELQKTTSSNIIDALTQDPAISQIGTGPGISKPVIRGLGFNRVVVIHDGMRQEGQQWGDEHGVEIDEYAINRVEIIKGAAGLMYGSDAIGGVINMMTSPSISDGRIQGDVLLNYQTNNGMIGGSAHLEGNYKGFIWSGRYSRKMAHDYQNAYDGYVFNSGFRENVLSGMLGLTKRWGYSHLYLSAYDMTLGIVEGERDSLTGEFLKSIALNDTLSDEVIVQKKDFTSYVFEKNVPFQKIRHYKGVLQNRFLLKSGVLDVNLGWQQNQRKEFDDILNASAYGLFLDAHTISMKIHYRLPEINHWNLSIGVNSQYQFSKNTGTEFLIPEFTELGIGNYLLFSRHWNKLGLSGGLRYDYKNQNSSNLWLDGEENPTTSDEENGEHKFIGLQKDYHGIAGSLGLTYQISKQLYTKLNLSKGFRTPNISELSSNGIHEGTVNYILGSASLKSENSWQTDFSVGWDAKHITAEIDIFHNYIQNFIFLQKLIGSDGLDVLTEGYQTFQYQSANTHLFGGEVSLDFHPHPLDWLHVKNTFGIVEAIQFNQPDSSKFLPMIPAPKWNIEVSAKYENFGKYLKNGFISIGVNQTFEKKNIYKANHTETVTPYYLLLNIRFGIDLLNKKNNKILTLLITVDNILNKTYQSHLSRLKYLDDNNATGRVGVFNMGRNFSFKLLIPIRIR